MKGGEVKGERWWREGQEREVRGGVEGPLMVFNTHAFLDKPEYHTNLCDYTGMYY